jgi:hypothetical protein
MQSIITLLISALSLLNLVQANPELPLDLKTNALKIAISAVQTAQDSLGNATSTTVTTQVTTTDIYTPPVSTSVDVPVFGAINKIINTKIMDTTPQLECTLSANTNKGLPSSSVDITWTSNAEKAVMTNNHIASTYHLEPVSGATKQFPLSSELGENNIFTATFTLGGQTKDCSVQVMTQE